MLLRRHHRLEESRTGRFCLSVIMLLCLCVLLQMLGVPGTLLKPVDMSDALGASVLEGFSVPPTLLQLAPSSEFVLLADVHPLVHGPILAFALFHPPVL